MIHDEQHFSLYFFLLLLSDVSLADHAAEAARERRRAQRDEQEAAHDGIPQVVLEIVPAPLRVAAARGAHRLPDDVKDADDDVKGHQGIVAQYLLDARDAPALRVGDGASMIALAMFVFLTGVVASVLASLLNTLASTKGAAFASPSGSYVIFALMYNAATMLMTHSSELRSIQFEAEMHPSSPFLPPLHAIPVKTTGGRLSPTATVRYRQNGDRHSLVTCPEARPHTRKGREQTAPTASHTPLRSLPKDSHRIAAMVRYRLGSRANEG
eukprot:CAMPEP_0172553896 /NCGR_PEP_ID=MMETSP1067-20121228/52273_1 /TAXON_ID=265564 ORGANISM="Thalassiosira punctigera, Strain Tpunct2005C2" /NCGR_SAMPLE_ID=MMETSP1067 /ASSEMBLY_ACC=CAM_ASM_000444 /LENGTH=268 /DNA_ID=CAMNT_0013342159 /DNA_START=66 /DNA_END=873 /DNA_ORIENTATION=-